MVDEQTANETEKPAETPASLLYDEQKTPTTEELPAEEVEKPAEVAEGEQTAEQPGEEIEEVEVSSLDELAEHYELDAEWLQNLKVTTKVNGEESAVPLSDLVGKYQQYQMGDVYLKESKEKARALVEEANQQKEAVASTVATFSKLLESAESEIDRDVKNIDWKKLREDDPAEYSAKKEEVRERRERLEKLKKEATDSYNRVAQEAREKQQALLDQNLPKERDVFLERVPEWSEDEKVQAERPEVIKYLSDDGWSEQDIKFAAYNGKLLAYVVKAMRYDKARAKSEVAKKKVTTVPRVLKPGPKSTEKPKTNGADKDDPVSILYPST